MISHTHKLIFIHNGKCAGSSINGTIVRDNPEIKYENTHHKFLSQVYKDIYSDYIKVCSVRDPWDRQVSWYHHLKSKCQNMESFEDWVMFSKSDCHTKYNVICYPEIENFDFFIKYENLEDDYQKLCDKLNLRNNGLLNISHNTNRPRINYSSYYTEKSIEAVKERNINVIDKFGYKFKY